LVTLDGAVHPDPAARELLARLAPSLRLEPISRQGFLTRSVAAPEQTLVVSTLALGRCSLDMLGAARETLVGDGLCLVFGPFISRSMLDRQPSGGTAEHATPVWSYLEAQAERCGLEPLLVETAAAEETLVALFRKTSTGQRWRLSTIHSDHATQVQGLFDQVFAPNRMSADHWHWKYGDGRGVGIGAWKDGTLVAHYGGVWRTIWWQREWQQAVQITDVMVSPAERGVLRRDGAFSLAAATFPECFTGYGAKALIGFGFPNERHFRAAALRQLYAEVDRLREISWPSLDQGSTRTRWPANAGLEAVTGEQLACRAAQLERLWTEMRESLPESIVGVRDWPYLRHRYLNNPLHQYRVVVLRRRLTGRWLALAILAVGTDGVHIRDLVGDRRHYPLFIHQLRRSYLCRDRPLRAWITASHAHCLDADSAHSRDLGVIVPHSIWTAGPSADVVKDRWWLTSGDTDFL
jgi:hypothetical protein